MSFPPSFFESLEDRLNLAVYDTNEEYREMSITGAAYLAESIKDRIESAKKRVQGSHDKINGGLDKLFKAADHADSIATKIENEADELIAQVGQFSNMGPEDSNTIKP